MTVVLTPRNLLHFFWPLRCAFCARPLPPNRRTDHLYCSDCRKQLRPAQTLTLPKLKLCLVYTTYTKSAARAVYRLKFHNQPQLADTMAELMARRLGGKILACRPDCICGVAMHPLKQRRRGYNQADELAAQLAKRLNLPCASLLEKRKNTAAQHTLSAEKRRSNLKGAYTVPCPQQVYGKRILLVDDVVTTGTTLSECAEALYAAGAQWVGAVCFAHPRSDKPPARSPYSKFVSPD